MSNVIKAEEKNDVNYLVKGNVLNQNSRKKKAEIKSLEEDSLVLYGKPKQSKL